MTRTVLINGRFLEQPLTGVQRYALEIMRHFDTLLDDPARNLEMTCLVPPGTTQNPGWKNIKIRPVGVNKANLWEQVDLPLACQGELLFSPSNIGPWIYSNQAITFHDAAVFAVPEAYSFTFRAKYRFIFHVLARRARLRFTDSVYSQDQLAQHLGVDRQRFNVILLGGDHMERIPADESILQRNNLAPNSYLLLVASQSPHKNLSRAVEAIQKAGQGIQFVMVGGRFKNVFQGNGLDSLPGNILHLGYVHDSELKALYQNALGFILPSIYEGFGLPVLEAQSCGCPVLSSTAASLPEVGGNAVLYFDPFNIDDMAEKIRSFLSDSALREGLRRAGYENVNHFRWADTARQILDLLSGLLTPTA